MFPTHIDNELEELKTNIIAMSSRLGRGMHPKAIQSISEFMLSVNSYYTNAMEGNPSLISDIQKALANNLSSDKGARNYQLEHVAHISVQKRMLERMDKEKNLDICSTEFLRWLHREFYLNLPEEMHFAHTHDGKDVPVLPGELRNRPSSVGKHIPPYDLDAVQTNLAGFQRAYSLTNVEESKKILALAASHHRLLWIHPFRDGNGRVARLFTIAYQHQLGVDSQGLWTVTRAFARRRTEYDKHLNLADQPRRNDYDGRGPLSEESLVIFCKYFLKECVDQIQFMNSLLELHDLEGRLNKYLGQTNDGLVVRELLHKGEIERGEIQRICNVERRRATEIIKGLLKKRLVCSDSPHGKLRLFISAESAPYLFPRLVV